MCNNKSLFQLEDLEDQKLFLNLVSPELAKPSYQVILQGESIQTSLLYIKIDKY